MKCKILHEMTGRLRVHLCCGRMTLSQADVLEYYLRAQDGVQAVKVYDRTQDAVVLYDAERGSILRALAVFSFAKAEAMELVPEHTSRALNREFEDKLAVAVMRRCISKLFLPAPITTALAVFRSVKYIREGLSALWHGKLSVAVLDATAVTVSMARGDFATAGSVMFMLHLGEILEEWTHKKSVADLASAMSLRVDSVWQQVNGTEVLTKITDVKPGDRIVIRTGGMIPLDGRVVEGEAMVNQSSLTGESMPVAKHPGSPVYAGTVAEEGECVISVEKSSGSGRYDRVALVYDVRSGEPTDMLIDTLEQLKASGVNCRMLFLEADTPTIINRYKETRRMHPLQAKGLSVEEAVRRERALMQPVRDHADFVLDTSSLSTAKLRSEMLNLFGTPSDRGGLNVSVLSFGFKHGIPIESDLVFDVRFMPNPYYVAELKNKTGLDQEVRDFVFSFRQTHEFMAQLEKMITFLLPLYSEEGKTVLVIGIGCTGGHHRSVAVAHELAEYITQMGYQVTENHRDISR